MRIATQIALASAVSLSAGVAAAEPASVAALLKPVEQIRMDFEDSNHFVLLVQREGMAEEGPTGPFTGASRRHGRCRSFTQS